MLSLPGKLYTVDHVCDYSISEAGYQQIELLRAEQRGILRAAKGHIYLLGEN